MASVIRILLPSTFSAARIRGVTTALQREFRASIEVKEFAFDFGQALDRARGQHLSAALIRQMRSAFPEPAAVRLLGITEVDLFAPVLTFVFGEAQLGGTCAVLSTFRLRNEFYGIPPDDAILSERIVKEAVHETGHLFGLIHCRNFECVMRSSTYVEEIDLKSDRLCGECADRCAHAEILNNRTLS